MLWIWWWSLTGDANEMSKTKEHLQKTKVDVKNRANLSQLVNDSGNLYFLLH